MIRKRAENDIWQGLYELPMMEVSKPLKRNTSSALADFFEIKEADSIQFLQTYKQLLSHQIIHFVFAKVAIKKSPQMIRVPLKKLGKYGFPKTLHLFLRENNLL